MSVAFVTGDLFAQPFPALAHGCNCSGAMGKGIAVEFRKRWPGMYQSYQSHCIKGQLRPGDVFTWKTEGLVIYNLMTQASWKTGATLDAIDKSVSIMLKSAATDGIVKVAMPRIGAGLGGLDWREVKLVLTKLAKTSSVELVVFEAFEANTRQQTSE